MADLATVLRGDGHGVFVHGRGDARSAVERAVSSVPSTLRIESGRAAPVHVVGSPTTSVEAVGGVVDAVREHLGRDAHLIRGTTIDDDGDGLELELAVGGVVRTHAPGGPCPRCGATLVGYSLGDRSTAACEACGFAGSTVRLG